MNTRLKLSGTGRRLLWILAAGAIALLGATLETGRANAQNTSFTFLGALSNVITPNGDGLNERAILCYANPRQSAVAGAVYDMKGKRVAALRSDANENCPNYQQPALIIEKLVWDGRVDGRPASGGVYVYQIQSEGKTITGTVMVVR